ncbi:MAG: alpha/beta hydrolase [Bacillota bacterium]
MPKSSEVDKYLKVKKITGIRMRTRLAEEAGERVFRPKIDESVVFETYQYKKGMDSYHQCDFIYCNKENEKTADENAIKPLIVYVHGGGWTVGSKEARRGMLSLFALQGFFVVSLNYTLCPEAEKYQQVKEIYAGIEFAFSKSKQYGFSGSDVFLCGDSAGAHLACLACVAKVNAQLKKAVGYKFNRDFEIKAVAPICGVFDFRTVLSCKFPNMKKFLWGYSRGKVRAFLKSERSYLESPINFAGDFPPCFIVMGEADKLKNQSLELIRELAQKEKNFKLFIGKGKGGFHVFPAMFTTEMARKCIGEVGEFFWARF